MSYERIPPEAFFIDRGSEVALHLQLQRQIVSAVLEGRFLPMARLPSTRALAQHLQVARVTVGQAFAELVSIDCLESRDRSGHYVSPRIDLRPAPELPSPEAPRFDWTRHLDGRFSASARRDFVADWRRYRFPFIYGQIDPEMIAHAAWRDCAVRALGRREVSAATADLYGQDDPELVDYILRHILPRRGIQARPDEILLTQGVQNGLWMVTEILLGRRGASGQVVIEDPGYPGLREILQGYGQPFTAARIDAEGLDPASLPQDTRVVFTTASHQCPTNAAMPMGRRRALLARAIAEGFAIIEDDYEFEMFFAGAPSPALKALDHGGAVIHLGSFSKTLFPGLRLGYLVADRQVVAEARALRGRSLRHPPGILQRTLAHFLALGHYDAQMTRMRQANAKRRAMILGAFAEAKLDLVDPARAEGSSLWLTLPEGVDSVELAADLRRESVLVEPGPPFFDDPDEGRRHLRLGIGAVPLERIPEGIALIIQAIRKRIPPDP